MKNAYEHKLEQDRLRAAKHRASLSPEELKKLYATNSARRSAKRAARAIAEGRIPGKAGMPPRLTPEERKASDKASYARYRDKNRERIRKRDAEIKRKLRETPEGRAKLCATNLKYAANHKEKVSIRQRAWVEANKEWKREYSKEYYDENKEIFYAANRTYRARKRGNGGKHTANDVKALWSLQNGICAWCDIALGDEKPHVDHWIPLSKGGSNDKSNLRLLHKKCNLSKHAKLPIAA